MRGRWMTGVALLALACGDDGGSAAGTTGGSSSSGSTAVAVPTTTGADGGSTTSEGPGSSSGTTTGEPPDDGPWEPGTVYPTPEGPNARGLLDRRGAIHSHSVYSHDACDEMPMDGMGNLDEVCFDDLRVGLCAVQHDFVMLSDHRESFSNTNFPDVLLYDEARGDALVERGGDPVASWAGCPGMPIRPTLLMAGCESATMPVGLEHHAPGRGATYGEVSEAAIEELKAAGAVSLVSHTEDWSVDELSQLPLDGFEMYNLHANLFANILVGLQLIQMVEDRDPGLPHSDLVVFPIWQEDPRYLERWGSVLASGLRRVTTLGTDAHRNSFPQPLPDGERIDSFRRMLQWFSNHLLIEPAPDGSWDDLAVKDALRAGRLFGVFEYMGYASGFDAVVESDSGVYEIGADVSLADGPEIVAQRPSVQQLDPEARAPVITLHVMRAIDGGFEEVASTDEQELRYTPEQEGAYRVEVRMAPLHLSEYLGSFAADAATPRVWIYANPFYVLP